MAYATRSRTRAVGAEAGSGAFSIGDNLDLKATYGFTNHRPDHSGQFQRNIQLMYGKADGTQWMDSSGNPDSFYHHLMNDLGVLPP